MTAITTYRIAGNFQGRKLPTSATSASLNNVHCGLQLFLEVPMLEHQLLNKWRDTLQLQNKNSTNLHCFCDTKRNVSHKAGANLKYYYACISSFLLLSVDVSVVL